MVHYVKGLAYSLLKPVIRIRSSNVKIPIDAGDADLYYYHTPATLFLHRPAVLSKSKVWVKEFISPLEGDFFKFSSLTEWLLPFRKINASKEIDQGVLLTYLYPENYFHWWIDMIARLALVKNKVPLNQYQFVANEPLNSWQEDSLEWVLGFKPSITIRREQVIKIGKLLTVSPIRTKKEISKAAISILRACLFDTPDGEGTTRDRIFVMRNSKKGRNISNMAEIEPILDDNGIRKVYFDDLSIREQARIMRDAGLIIAVHGAALTNIIFAPRGLKLIEVFGAFHNPLYCNLAKALEFDYYKLTGVPEGDSKRSDIRVDPTSLEKMLSQCLY